MVTTQAKCPAKDGATCEEVTLNSFPDDVIANVLSFLPQRQRARAALCCRRWAHLCASSHTLWQQVALEGLLPASRSLPRMEGFLAWLTPRAANVQHLTITEPGRLEADPQEAFGQQLAVLWGNCVAAIALLAPHLRQLTLEWPGELVLSQWAGVLRQLQLASFISDRLIVREGLNRLSSLTELRLKSSKAPLTLHSPGVLPNALLKLRLEGCNLGGLPPSLSALTLLEDLVLSDNLLGDADMQELACLVSLRQLTLMGCRMRRVPPSLGQLSKLQVLYLDMGIQGPPVGDPIHLQLATVLAPLRRLGILSLGACFLQEFPAELASMGTLRALYLDDNAIPTLPEGPYLSQLRVLGIDWRVLLASHSVLLGALRLRKLCLMSVGKEVQSAPHMAEDAAAVVESLVSHPSLQQVLLPQVDGQRCPVHLAVLNVIIGISRAPHLRVAAVGYAGIENEWLCWLEALDEKPPPAAGLA